MNLTKSLSISIAVVATFFACEFFLPKKSAPEFRQPTSTLVRDRGDERDERAEFEAWYNGMHKAAPGVNWKAMDAATREQNYFSLAHTNTQRNGPQVTAQEVLANGNLVGQWNERGATKVCGRIWAADLDTATGEVYCGSDGGNVWKGNMNGTSWTVLNDKIKFGIGFLRVTPRNGGHRVIASGGAFVHYSDDEGVTWYSSSGLSVLQNWGWIKRAITLDDAQHTMYLLTEEWDYTNWNAIITIYKSTDNAVSFAPIVSYPEPVYGSVDNFDVWAPHYGVSDVSFMHNDSIFNINRTTDAVSFVGTIALNATGNTLLTGFKNANNFILYAYVAQNLYKSTDGGATWGSAISFAYNPFGASSFGCSCTNPNNLYFGDIECHISNDAGVTWNIVNTWWSYYSATSDHLHGDIPSITSLLDAQGNEFQFVGTDGGLFVSHDNLQTVQNLALLGLNSSQYYSVYTNKNDYNFIYAGSQDQGFQRNQLDSATVLGFDQVYSGDYGHICSQDGGSSIWMNYPGFTDYYANGLYGGPTASWNFSGFNTPNPFWIPPMTSDRDINTRAYLAGGSLAGAGGHIIQEDVNGTNINVTELPYDFNAASGGGNISAIEISPINHSYWYVLTDNGKFFRSIDAGVTWNMSNVPGLGAHYWYGATIYPSQTTLGVVYCGGSGYSNPPAYRTTNNGTTFTAITNGIPSTLIFELKGNFNDSLIFAATEVGPYVYVVSENTWYNIQGVGAPNQTYWSVDYVPATNTARFATYGRGIWDFAIASPSPTGILENHSQTSLSVFPNPATDQFSVRIHSNTQENSQLVMLDLQGKEVMRESVNLQMGENNFPVNCATFNRGIYLVEIVSANSTSVQKIIITK